MRLLQGPTRGLFLMSEVALYFLQSELDECHAQQGRCLARGLRFGACLPHSAVSVCRVTSLIRNNAPLGPYSRTMRMALWWSQGGGAVSYDRGTNVLGLTNVVSPGCGLLQS